MSTTDGGAGFEPSELTSRAGEPGERRSPARRWPLIIWLWLISSLALCCLVHQSIRPTYESFSILRIEPTRPVLFGPHVRSEDPNGIQPFLETQRNLILTDRVLEEALADDAVKRFPVLTASESNDPKFELRKKLTPNIIPGTYLIRVAYDSNDPGEAVAVVKAVVEAFIRQHRQFNLGDTDSLKTLYEGYIKEKRGELQQKKAELIKLIEKEDQAAREKPDAKLPPSRVIALRADYLREDINSLTSNLRQVENKLEQLKFESQNTLVRVFLQDPASLPKTPRADDRMLYTALVPIATLPVLIGLFFLFERLARRRAGSS
jgi:hypothetical protein